VRRICSDSPGGGGSRTLHGVVSRERLAKSTLAPSLADGSHSSRVWDLIVGLRIAAMNADAARKVWTAGREEHRVADSGAISR